MYRCQLYVTLAALLPKDVFHFVNTARLRLGEFLQVLLPFGLSFPFIANLFHLARIGDVFIVEIENRSELT